MCESLNLRIVNISVKNAIMPKEFYWNELKIDRLNETLAKAKPNECQNFQILAPRMPFNSSPLTITLHLKNLSDSVERELKVFKQLLCECSMKTNRLRKDGVKLKCLHKGIVELRPIMFEGIKANTVQELELTLNYALLGQTEVIFTLVSSSFTIKLQIVLVTLEFDPTAMLITNQLAPVAINLFPAPQQALWLFNPYSSNIKLRLISGSPELTLIDDQIVLKSHQHWPMLLTFSPNHIGSYELQIEIVFNDCKSSMKIYGECYGHEQDLLDASFKHNSPNFDLSSKLNSIVLYGNNMNIILQQNGFASENLICLQNNSKACIKYEWEDLNISNFPCEVLVEPRQGYLKTGFTKLFRVSVKSLGSCTMLQTVPIKCSIFHYNKEKFREYTLPDGYFEFTEKGFYEKPLDWIPNCLKFLQSVYLNVNIRVTSQQEINKYMSKLDNNEHKRMMQQFSMRSGSSFSEIFSSTLIDGDFKSMTSEKEVSDDKQHIMEMLISLILNGSKYKERQKIRSHEEYYATLHKIRPDNDVETKQKSYEDIN